MCLAVTLGTVSVTAEPVLNQRFCGLRGPRRPHDGGCRTPSACTRLRASTCTRPWNASRTHRRRFVGTNRRSTASPSSWPRPRKTAACTRSWWVTVLCRRSCPVSCSVSALPCLVFCHPSLRLPDVSPAPGSATAPPGDAEGGAFRCARVLISPPDAAGAAAHGRKRRPIA